MKMINIESSNENKLLIIVACEEMKKKYRNDWQLKKMTKAASIEMQQYSIEMQRNEMKNMKVKAWQ